MEHEKKKKKRETERQRESIYIWAFLALLPGYPLCYEPLRIKRKGEILLLRYNWSSI